MTFVHLSPCLPVSLCQLVCSVLCSCVSLSHLPVVRYRLYYRVYFRFVLCFAFCFLDILCFVFFRLLLHLQTLVSTLFDKPHFLFRTCLRVCLAYGAPLCVLLTVSFRFLHQCLLPVLINHACSPSPVPEACTMK